MSWDTLELAYFAGFIDGEGSFGLTPRKGKPTFQDRLEITQVNKEILEYLASIFGGHIYLLSRQTKTRRVAYRLLIMGDTLKNLLPAIIPFLKLKKLQAEMILKYQQTLYYGGRKLSEGVYAERKNIKEKLRGLNRRGV